MYTISDLFFDVVPIAKRNFLVINISVLMVVDFKDLALLYPCDALFTGRIIESDMTL